MCAQCPAYSRHPLVAQIVKNLPAMQETQVQSLGQKDPLEKEMATHSRILGWGIHGQGRLADYSPWGRKKSGRTWQLSAYTRVC